MLNQLRLESYLGKSFIIVRYLHGRIQTQGLEQTLLNKRWPFNLFGQLLLGKGFNPEVELKPDN